jgi:hypothetical protein
MHLVKDSTPLIFLSIAVLERIPVFARFSILDFIDLGGDLNIKVTLDQSEDVPLDPVPIGLHQEVYICISKDRQPKLVTFSAVGNREGGGGRQLPCFEST